MTGTVVNLPPVRQSFSRLMLARFSAATWNTHRIHVDPLGARAEGLPDVVVQSTLYPEAARRVVAGWLGDRPWRLRAVTWRNLRPVTPDTELLWTGTVDDPQLKRDVVVFDLLATVAGERAVTVTVDVELRPAGSTEETKWPE